MPREAARNASSLVVLAWLGAALVLSACGNAATERDPAGVPVTPGRAVASSGVPSAFRHACGKPGSVVWVDEGTTRVDAADCDLRKVSIKGSPPNCGGAVVPEKGMGVRSITEVVEGLPCSVDVSVTRRGDVTVKVVRG